VTSSRRGSKVGAVPTRDDPSQKLVNPVTGMLLFCLEFVHRAFPHEATRTARQCYTGQSHFLHFLAGNDTYP